MEVSKEHAVDCGERNADGSYDYYYAYLLFRFREGDEVLVARSYDDEKLEVHFLCKEIAGRPSLLCAADVTGPLFAAACRYLRRVEGRSAINVLQDGGYVEVESAEEG